MTSNLFSSINKHNIFSKVVSKKKSVKDIEFIIWFFPFILVILSSVLIASTQRQIFYTNWLNHLTTGVVGMILAYCISKIDIERLRQFLLPLYLITVSSLFAVKLIGTYALGAQRWLNIGGFNIQPSEIAKIIVIITLA